MSKPSIPTGTRDFSPEEVSKRNYIFEILRKEFQLFGFLPMETPSMEKLTTLTGKYGEEGDQLLFKILKRGAKFNHAVQSAQTQDNVSDHFFSEEALRYDLTVPFARYVVQHQNEIHFPFKRYQIQPVWRADRPQRGRYREFYQCDVDVIGTSSLNAEIELIQIIRNVFTKLQLPNHTIQINNRKILYALIESCGEIENFEKIAVIIDKLDKVGKDNVLNELKENFNNPSCNELFATIFDTDSDIDETLTWLQNTIGDAPLGNEGIQEIRYITNACDKLGIQNVKLNLTLARGLNYYTGCIFEVILNNYNMGSVVGGGRYDNLTSQFGLNDISGVGISFGAERIFDVLNECQLFPTDSIISPEYLIIDRSDNMVNAMMVANKIRESLKRVMIYPNSDHKLKKQLKYANQNNIPYIVFVNEEFREEMEVELKNMDTGKQHMLKLSQFLSDLNE
ncbi:MAG: histidine--tRNA ligase [Bacteroidota bacterium]|nr:histidine--tRNA ligase [Bacteroidota bacterium]